jgi:hypothetical protein
MAKLRLFCPVAVIAVALLGFQPRLRAQHRDNVEYSVKAVFLLNFARFVEWPPAAFASEESPMELCVLGKDPFGRLLDDVAQGETVEGRRLVIRRISAPPAAKTCQILYVDPEWKDLPKVLSALGHGFLTVSEGPGFLRDGGMISFVIDNRRVRFDINSTVPGSAGLKVSSKLLNVARSVKK